MSSLLQLPIVTQDDLSAFHARVFGSSAPLITYASVPDVVYREHDREPFAEADDGLGYYPDGRKRTLTDEQIAMFRHSEVYAILRQRQVEKERKENDGDDSGVEDLDDIDEATESSSVPQREEAFSDTVNQGPISQTPDVDRPHTTGSNKKRKRRYEEASGNTSRIYTPRGAVRELDAATTAEQVLDYGEEQSAVSQLPDSGGKPTSEAIDIELRTQVTQNEPVKGRKIWWPVIGE